MTDDYLDMADTANTFNIHSTSLDGFVERFFASGKM